MESNTIALLLQSQIHNSSTIYKFEQNQLAATPSSNPKPTNINTTTNKTRGIKSKWRGREKNKSRFVVKERIKEREKKKDGGVGKKKKPEEASWESVRINEGVGVAGF